MDYYEKKISYVPVDVDVFRYIIKISGHTLSDFEELTPLHISKRTIVNQLKDNRLRKDYLYAIAEYINVDPDLLSGEIFRGLDMGKAKMQYLEAIALDDYPFMFKLEENACLFFSGLVEKMASTLGFSCPVKEDDLRARLKMEIELLDAIYPIFQKYLQSTDESADLLERMHQRLKSAIIYETRTANVEDMRQKLIDGAPHWCDRDKIRDLNFIDLVGLYLEIFGDDKKAAD